METIRASIQEMYDSLSKSQKKVANYMVEHPESIAMKSASEVGELAGVSETTVIRFCYALKFSGFTELQNKVREQLVLRKSSLEEYHAKNLELADQPHFFAKVMEQDCDNIMRTIQNVSEDDFSKAVEQIITSEKIYIYGMRTSYSSAHWLTFSLRLFRDNVHLIRPETDDLLCIFNQMNENSTFIAISFHRYLKETILLSELAKKQRSFLIGITDSPLAPIRKYADLLLPIYQVNKSTLNATPALFSLLNAIVSGVSIKENDRFESRMEQYEKLSMDHLFL
ncbi:MurR/RpiR family transcriptional regulator [Calidifontibacillus oryziterrae]|uniref:MurR/RpiR family transcriptional regulator n=1 Tax=Calidifontibacillus oryziterrae TaxID=1191699 RepID=UPI0002E4DACE|nr:MurR/RpiR family transcriptional regulator [Calidifontibacillus oryziterrae]